MKNKIFAILSTAAVLTFASIPALAEDSALQGTAIKTNDALMEINLPSGNWYQIISEENTEMFSDGNCAILVNLYKSGDALPAIETADANHEMIYTAAASTPQYTLLVVGYAHSQEDFSGICKAINTISIDSSKITDSMLNHAISTEQYGIAAVNYQAWVTADGLNVRSTSETDASIIDYLDYGDEVTVTGIITRSGKEIGWARISTSDGNEGYVSSQFLTTFKMTGSTGDTTSSNDTETTKETEQQSEQPVIASKTEAIPTGEVYLLFDVNGNEAQVSGYTDGSWRTQNGVSYWENSEGQYVDAYGDVLTPSNGDQSPNIYRTGNCKTVYSASTGYAATIYEYSTGGWYDDIWEPFTQTDDLEWSSVGGSVFYEYPVFDGSEPEYQAGESFYLTDEDGNSVTITKSGSYTYTDEYGIVYYVYNNYGTYIDENGLFYYAR